MSESNAILVNKRNRYVLVAALAFFGLLYNCNRILGWTTEDDVIHITSLLGLIFNLLAVTICTRRATAVDATLLDRIKESRGKIEDRLEELERLKRRDMVTPEEYAAKRQEILKDL
jgi:hypothetical protein